MSATRTRPRAVDDGPPSDFDPPHDYGPPATRPVDEAAQAVTEIASQMGGDAVVQIAAPPMLPSKVSATVARRVAAVLAEAEWVEKRGKNNFQGYQYATIDDLRHAVGQLCGKHGLSWRQDEIRAYPVGTKLLAVTYQFCLYAEDEPDAEAFPSRVTVLASLVTNKGGMDDKAFSKARSLAWKDWAKSQFAIPTGDDPEPASDADPDAARGSDDGQRDADRSRGARQRLDDIADRAAGRRTLSVPKAKGPADWTEKAIEVIAGVRNADELDTLLAAERHNIQQLETDHPDLHARVTKAIAEIRISVGD